MTVSECVFHVSTLLVALNYIYSKFIKVDIFVVPKAVQYPLLLRCIHGFLSDVFLFVAFMYTSYSKAFCLFFLNTLMCPFLARWMLKEQIKPADIIGIIIGFGGLLMLVQPWKTEAGEG